MANQYKKYSKADIINKDGGYKARLLFAPIDTFLVNALPATGPNPALGDSKKIAADHTFQDGEGWVELTGKINSATSKFTTVGDPGAHVFEHTFEIEVLGNSPELYDMLEQLSNDEAAFLLKDANCLSTPNHEQYGDECLTPTIKIEFDAKTTADGTKVHKITGTIRGHKYWYSGAVTLKPV